MGRIILVFACVLAGGVGFVWMQSAARLTWAHGLAVFFWLMVCLLTVREAFARQDEGVLHWDGRQWCRETAAGAKVGMPLVRIDFQHWLLLEFRSEDGRSIWLWPARKAAPLYWNALRRALFAGVLSVNGIGDRQGTSRGAVGQGRKAFP